ncbi:MAG TPA: carboxypeptidase-like regulatory domain-containing protein, partial [Bacteroidota bacterium]|nr:carboxypeptidase-like regulatory domain-containing protein [Bacteroidota bacterium]
LTLRGRQSIFTPADDGKAYAFLVEYTVPLGIPVTRLTGSGTLRGRVSDELTQAPLGDVVLYAGGATAVTDAAGEFLFPSLKPDVYAVQVDVAAAGVDRVTARPAPFLVTVLGGEVARLDIGVIPSASLSGEVTVFDERGGPSADTSRTAIAEAGKGSGLVVELTGSEGTLRRFTDNRGKFRFADIRPGEWVLRLLPEGLPEYHYIERDSIRLTLSPRGRVDTTFRVLPRKRRIQILEEGSLRQGGAPPVVKPAPMAPAPKAPGKKPPRRGIPAPGGKARGALAPSLRRSGTVISVVCWRVEVKAYRDVSPDVVD